MFAIVSKSDFSIKYIYDSDAAMSFGGPWGDSNEHWNVQIPAELNPDTVIAQSDGAGGCQFVANTAKTNAYLGAKLDTLRLYRAAKLAEVDVMVNDIVLLDGSLTALQVKDYRTALKNVTDPYKNYASDAGHAAALDALDLSTFEWPVKPT